MGRLAFFKARVPAPAGFLGFVARETIQRLQDRQDSPAAQGSFSSLLFYLFYSLLNIKLRDKV